MLIRGKWVLASCGHQRRIIQDAAVYIENGLIRDVGKYAELSKKYGSDQELGTDHHIVMPGLVNAHQHGRGISSYEVGLKDCPLELWLPNLIFLYPKFQIDQYSNTLLSCARMIENGITTSIHHFYGCDVSETKTYAKDLEQTAKAYVDSGMRVALAPSITDQNETVYLNEKEFVSCLPQDIKNKLQITLPSSDQLKDRVRCYFKVFDVMFGKYQNYDGRIKMFLGPSGVQWCSDDLLCQVKKKARTYGIGIHMHLLETKYQRECSLRLYGESGVQHLSNLDFLGPEVSCAHSVWLDQKDIKKLAETQTIVIHNPSSNLRLFSGTSPVVSLLEERVPVALGVDSTGLDDQEDMFQQMRLCSLIHRTPGLVNYRRYMNTLNSNKILDMASVEGAKAAGFGTNVGVIEQGKKADIILVNSQRSRSPYVDPKISMQEILVGRVSGIDVETVIIDGKIIMKDRQFMNLDKKTLLKTVKQSVGDIDKETLEAAKKLEPLVLKHYQTWNID